MKATYYPDTDTLRIVLGRPPFKELEGEDAGRDIVLLFDGAGHLAEIEIEHASRRVDLDEFRRVLSFEERRAKEATEAL